MKRSTDRILTTHTGSLPRPADLIEMLRKKEYGEAVDEAQFQTRVRQAVIDVVKKQVECGVDVVSDGEQGKPGYATYIHNRVRGFGGEHRPPVRPSGEGRDFPEYTERRTATTAASLALRPYCDGPIEWADFEAVNRDVSNFAAAIDAANPTDAFMTAASPGVTSFFLVNQYYKTEDEYLEAIAAVMRDEYVAIAAAGISVQLDCPDLAMSRQSQYVDDSIEDFRSMVARHIEVVNEATKNIAPEQLRLHLCWGNYEGPHHLDVPLKDIIDIVLTSRATAISFEGANPRHEHEWAVWKDVKLPDGKLIIPGVIDSTTNFIEHPELVAQRIERYAQYVGRENVIAGSDCGFGTNAASNTVDHRIAWAKMEAMAQGARIASERLW